MANGFLQSLFPPLDPDYVVNVEDRDSASGSTEIYVMGGGLTSGGRLAQASAIYSIFSGVSAVRNALPSTVSKALPAAEIAPGYEARFGTSVTTDYRTTFLNANPELQGEVIVHHAVEQQTLTRFPGAVTEAEIHSLENLRGIPKTINSDLHLSQIRKELNQFYRQTPNATKQQLLQKATEIDLKYGKQFNPPVGGGG
jgi:hypothetical protein